MESEQAILALAALAQATRLGVFRLLVKHEPDGLAAGDIAKLLAVPQNTMSAHLAVLARADLVMSERKSRSIISEFRSRTPRNCRRSMRGFTRPAATSSSRAQLPAAMPSPKNPGSTTRRAWPGKPSSQPARAPIMAMAPVNGMPAWRIRSRARAVSPKSRPLPLRPAATRKATGHMFGMRNAS